MSPRRDNKNALFWVETALLALSAPFLLFPTLVIPATVGVLLASVLWWLARWGVDRQPLPTTPFNGALLLWGITVAVGIAVTAYPDLTLPKATGLILGLAAWRYLALTVRDRRGLRWAVAGLVLIGLAVAALGALGARWTVKIPGLQPLLARLPERLLALPESPEGGINANQLAGAMVFYLPLALAWLLGTLRFAKPAGRATRVIARAMGGLAGVAAAGGLLVLTQSRSGWIGGALGVLALLFLWGLSSNCRWGRRIAWGLLAVTLVAGGVVAAAIDPAQLSGLWETPGGVSTDVGNLSLASRVEIWSRALYAVQDFPFTGCGLGTFRQVVWVLYPPFTLLPGSDFAHAHNIFLQVAVDTGIPGLVAYLALLGIAGAVGWRVAKDDPRSRPLALGLVAGLIALHTYGLTDALAPGSKPGVILWCALGLLAAAARLGPEAR